jgi:hypothetical protein
MRGNNLSSAHYFTIALDQVGTSSTPQLRLRRCVLVYMIITPTSLALGILIGLLLKDSFVSVSCYHLFLTASIASYAHVPVPDDVGQFQYVVA